MTKMAANMGYIESRDKARVLRIAKAEKERERWLRDNACKECKKAFVSAI